MMLILDECLCIHLEVIKNGLVDGTGEVIQIGDTE
jgi:hypothetical protein